MNRRDFLKQAVVVGATLSTSSLNTFVFGQRSLERKGATKRVIIIGAGLAGLSAPYELTQAGHDVTVLELARGQAARRYIRIFAEVCRSWRFGFQVTITSR